MLAEIRHFFPEKLAFFLEKLDFSQNVSQLHRNLTWGFFSGPSRVFDIFRVATLQTMTQIQTDPVLRAAIFKSITEKSVLPKSLIGLVSMKNLACYKVKNVKN